MESPLQTANDRTEKKVKSKKLTDTEHLLRSLKDKDKAVRDAAAEALGKIGDTRALEPLREALNDADTDVRESAERALNIIAERLN